MNERYGESHDAEVVDDDGKTGNATGAFAGEGVVRGAEGFESAVVFEDDLLEEEVVFHLLIMRGKK
jgi:hypothetical protein